MPLKNIQNGREFSAEMRESLAQFNTLVEKRLPEKVEVVLEKVILDSFEQEAYQDKPTSKWASRKKKDEGRKILIGKGSGKLKRSIEVTRSGPEIKASTDVIYAPVHNEGLRAGKGAGFTMPQRQFMPIQGQPNEILDSTIEKWMDDEMDKIFK